MTPSLALAATITGTLLTVAPITPQAVRDARTALDPTAPFEQDPEVAADLATIRRITAWLPNWQLTGVDTLHRQQAALSEAEDRLLAAHGHEVPTDAQRYEARMARAAAVQAVYDAAEAAHPAASCPKCHAWEDCPAADKALRDATHTDWADRWHTAA